MAIDLALARLLKKLSLKMAMEATVLIEIWGVWRDSILPHKSLRKRKEYGTNPGSVNGSRGLLGCLLG